MEIKDIALITKLKDIGVAKVTVMFDGSGDDGDIQWIEYYNEDEKAVDGLSSEDEGKLSDICYTMIDNKVHTVGDWVNNEGGYGYLYIDVIKLTSYVEYYQRTVQEADFPVEPLFQ
jgi:hypothetical protein